MLSDNPHTDTTLSDNSRSHLVHNPHRPEPQHKHHHDAPPPAAHQSSSPLPFRAREAWLTVAGALLQSHPPSARISLRHQVRHASPDPTLMLTRLHPSWIGSVQLFLMAFGTNLGLFVPFFYLQLFAEDHGVSSVVTTYILAILNAGSTLGRILPVALAGSLGVYAMLLPAIAASAGFVFALLGVTGDGGVGAVAALFGLSSGTYVSLIPPLLGTLCTDMSELGLRMGLAFSLVGTSMLVGTPVFGALLDTRGGGERVWWRAVVFAGRSYLPVDGARVRCGRGAHLEDSPS
ncbi:hypothetical protein BN946_scf184582.g2 [Trametes cinnabarina]|uniref:Major facilitator superfamily (MFS) profile domain-containing protein n=1 Tax=Pycnoporus cinnabarinus TaxID=5643 RepID=A0A060SPK8_PYCCI|nr:hypothetical protein BN946_scf184582.g2 [Trametes cinnabarina]